VEISQEEKVNIAESAVTIVEASKIKLNMLREGSSDDEFNEYDSTLAELEKYCKNQLRMIRGY
jgi:hypothetical protein